MMITAPSFLTDEQIVLFDRMADRLVRMRLTTPAILFLESVRPLNYLGSQAMVFFAPFVHAFFSLREYDLIQEALEHRETLGYLADLLEEKDATMREVERTEKRARRRKKRGSAE
ncbi:MAG: hypothetical protein V1784_12010 [bacterium]